VTGVTLQDGAPASEVVDGVYTRRLTTGTAAPGAEPNIFSQYVPGARSLSIWVSTEISPTIRRMRIDGSMRVQAKPAGLANAVAFSPDGKRLAVSGTDGTWRVQDPTAAPRTILDSARSGGRSLAFSPDGALLATARDDGAAQLWDMRASASAAPTPLTEPQQGSDAPFALTWTWSRFNEDLGPVHAPPSETIKAP
jgi:WD40 repeat protein